VELLRNQADTKLEENQIERLEEAAASGNSTAAAALRFRSSGKKLELKELQLDSLLGLMNARAPIKRPSGRKTITFFDALDEGLLSPEVLKDIAESWSPDVETFSKEVEVKEQLVRIEWKADHHSFRIISGDQQIIATERRAESNLDVAQLVLGNDLLAAAKNADVIKGGHAYASLASQLLAKREKLTALLQLHSDLLEVLISSDKERSAAGGYWSAWTALADTIIKDPEQAAVSALVRYLSMMDAHWVKSAGGDPSRYQALELMCIHPYVLRPLLELAQYGRVHLGEQKLGTRLLWAYDKVLPAYPAIWRDSDVFIHSAGEETPQYAVRAPKALPSLSTARGVTEIIRSFVGLHPYARKHLAILLIDPPGGGGIVRALDGCISSELVERMTVYVAHTDRRDTEFPVGRAKVEYLGNIKSADTWAGETGVATHLCFAFRRARDADAGSHTGNATPSRGLHNSLTASLVPPEHSEGGEAGSWVPKVFLQPRDSNDVVQQTMLLARQSYKADRLYRISPMLPQKDAADLEKVARVSEWFIVATPTPIGLVPPRTFPGGTLAYIGREDCGPYGLFAYARDLFAVRKQFERVLNEAPIAASPDQVEKEVRSLALNVPNGILRIGRTEGKQVLGQVGLMAASLFAREA
jgi:hypothetical protein